MMATTRGEAGVLHGGAFRPIARLARLSAEHPQGFPQKLWKTDRMRSAPAVVALTMLAIVGIAAAPPPSSTPETPSTAVTTDAVPAASPTPVSRVTRQLLNRRLDLPTYARFGTDPFAATAADLPAFSETVQVFAKPMDTQALTAKMKWWMGEDFEPFYAGTAPARFHAPTLAEMREYRPSPPQSADLSTLLGILIGRIKGDDKKR
jgi:hypothetical protein